MASKGGGGGGGGAPFIDEGIDDYPTYLNTETRNNNDTGARESVVTRDWKDALNETYFLDRVKQKEEIKTLQNMAKEIYEQLIERDNILHDRFTRRYENGERVRVEDNRRLAEMEEELLDKIYEYETFRYENAPQYESYVQGVMATESARGRRQLKAPERRTRITSPNLINHTLR